MPSSILVNLSVLFDKPTGIATYARNILPSLASLNPTLLAAQEFAGFNCYSIPPNITPAQGSKGHFKRLLWNQFQLPRIYQQTKASLIFSPIPEAPLFNDCRYIVMCHDLIPLRFPRPTSALTYYFRYIVPLVLKQAEHIICNSEATAKDIRNFYGIKASKITPILLGYDSSHFYPREIDSSASKKPYFLYLGRQDTYKNLSGLISAFAAINNTNYELRIAGSTDPRFTPKLKRQARELNVINRISWLDYLDYQELPKVISSAIALVFPTLWEGFGLPVLEAMACGTPVISSNLACLPEITGDAAILVDPYNTAAITAAMIEIGQNSFMRLQLRQKSIKQAKKFSWKKTGAATKTILERYM